MNQKERRLELTSLNDIKTILMLSVIFYHCIRIWAPYGWHGVIAPQNQLFAYLVEWLSHIHTQTFTFLSGYLFYYIRYEKGKYRNVSKDVKRRAQRLLVPYSITLVVWAIPFYLILDNGTAIGVLKKYILATSPAQLWYCLMLFIVFLIFYYFSDRMNNSNLTFVFFYCIAVVSLSASSQISNWFQFLTAMEYCLYFYFGYAVRKGAVTFLYRINSWILLGIYSLTIYGLTKVSIPVLLIHVLMPIISLIGISAIIGLFSGIDFSKNKSWIWNRLKNYNFCMYLFHQQLLYFVIHQSFPNSFVWILVNLTVSIVGSFAISCVLNLFDFTRKIFL